MAQNKLGGDKPQAPSICNPKQEHPYNWPYSTNWCDMVYCWPSRQMIRPTALTIFLPSWSSSQGYSDTGIVLLESMWNKMGMPGASRSIRYWARMWESRESFWSILCRFGSSVLSTRRKVIVRRKIRWWNGLANVSIIEIQRGGRMVMVGTSLLLWMISTNFDIL